MNEPKEIYTVEIPFESTLYEWTRSGEGKDIIFPELLIGCEELLYDEVDKVHCMDVITYETGMPETINLVVRLDGIENTLSKILQWAERNEFYESCIRIRELQNKLKQQNEQEVLNIEKSTT